MFMANPELSEPVGELLEDEGCLSIPGPYHPTPRFARIRCRGQDLEGDAVRDDRRGTPRADLPARDRSPRRDALHRPPRRRGSSRRDGAAPADRDGARRTGTNLAGGVTAVSSRHACRVPRERPLVRRTASRARGCAGHRGRARGHQPPASRRAGIPADADRRGGRGSHPGSSAPRGGPDPGRRGLRRPRLAGARRDRGGRLRRRSSPRMSWTSRGSAR